MSDKEEERPSESEWLICYGWRPSPTTSCSEGAWEHVAWSMIPESCYDAAKERGLYSHKWWRHPTGQACAITMSMLALAETCVVIPREVIDGQL